MIKIDMLKAKEIAHKYRRAKRELEFTPYDEVIMKQIPGVDKDAAEIARQAIRAKYDTIQVSIDACTDAAQLKQIMIDEGLVV